MARFHSSGSWKTRRPPRDQSFEARAGDPGYAALVQIKTIDWNPGFTKTPITSASQIAALSSAGEISINDTGIITDDPIVAIGGLGGAWLPQPPGTYRIPQGTVDSDYLSTKLITLPTYRVAGENETSEQSCPTQIVVPDVSDPAVAAYIGANVAPGLLAIDSADVQSLRYLLPPNPPAQLPLIQESPNGFGVWNPTSNTRRLRSSFSLLGTFP